MDLLVGTSLAAAFIAGLAALFAPCCITVLLPSYFASVFRERTKIFFMTFVFFLGVLAVFLPLGLGAAFFGQFLSRYHNAIFVFGGIFLLVLGLIIISGRHLALPWHVNPAIKNYHPFSVFILGILSGIATTCCAPVLAGVLALSVLPGSVLWGLAYTLSYVLGMVAPLFFLASILDKSAANKKMMVLRRSISYHLGSAEINVTMGELVSGAMFTLMGMLILFLSFTNRLAAHSAWQVDINIYLTKLLHLINGFIAAVPEYVWAAVVFTLFIFIVTRAVNSLKK
ncbi:MAG: hypothetical protein HYT31_04135 [Parcubacteria group bacterium]|nr:hypothetical protein [Parcubacteria group bacterium]